MLFIEAWMMKTKYRENVDNYTLLGHSLGGYLCTNYAISYPHKIEKLFLASPVGIPVKPEGYNQKRFELQPTKFQKFK